MLRSWCRSLGAIFEAGSHVQLAFVNADPTEMRIKEVSTKIYMSYDVEGKGNYDSLRDVVGGDEANSAEPHRLVDGILLSCCGGLALVL